MSDVLVLTFATNYNVELINWVNSLEHFDYTHRKGKYSFDVLGLGTKWKNFITRLRAYKDYISRLNDKELPKLIIFVDCYDLLACGPPLELYNLYFSSSYRGKVVFGAEVLCGGVCHPVPNWWEGKTISKYQYVNGGFLMGPPLQCLELFEKVIWYSENHPNHPDLSEKLKGDDQWGFGRYLNDNPDIGHLDHNVEYVANLILPDTDFTFLDGRVTYKKNGNKVFFVHSPAMIGDIGHRYNRYGKSILDDKFIKCDLTTSRNYNTLVLSTLLIILILLLAISLFPKYTPIFILAVIIFSCIWFKLLNM